MKLRKSAAAPSSRVTRSQLAAKTNNNTSFQSASVLIKKSSNSNFANSVQAQAPTTTTTMAGSSSSSSRGGRSKKKSKPNIGTKGRRRPFRVAYTNRKAAKLLSESGNNELSMESMSFLPEEEKVLLSSWGLPTSVLMKYRLKGITSLFEWQLQCLDNEKVLKGSNIVYSAPTSAGKTLVAEILMLKRVLELGKKAIMILPFVSVAREKMYSLQELFGDVGIRVEGFMGSYNPPGGFQQVDIAVCTIEKANSLINRLLEEGGLSQLGTIVVDELHLIGDSGRGYLLELLLTKIRFTSTPKFLQRNNSMNMSTMSSDSITDGDVAKQSRIQIIGMSATLPNLSALAKWLDAELVISDFRPVPLVERIKLGGDLFDSNLEKVGPALKNSMVAQENDPDHILSLSLETILDGHSILIFCPTKQMCETEAVRISKQFFKIGVPAANVVGVKAILGEKLRNQLDGKKLEEVRSQLAQCPAGLDDFLKIAVSFGVAFHHAGLTFDERDIIESAFKRGIIRVMVATSTLSAGVNLPARRVLIITPKFDSLDVLTYRQMSGRAGRKGVDTEGESILVSSLGTEKRAIGLIQASLPTIKSALINSTGSITQSMKRALLEVIASGVVKSPEEVKEYADCTLHSHVRGENDSEKDISASEIVKSEAIVKCLEFLEQNDFIRLTQYESPDKVPEYMTTQLGSACLASSLSPDEGIIVLKQLEKARESFVLKNELHVVYQVTPIYLADQWRDIDWDNFMYIWDNLSADEKKVGYIIGIRDKFTVSLRMGLISKKHSTPEQRESMNLYQRFYTALALSDLVNEMSISEVAKKYLVNKGVIQNLQQSASTFAGMVSVFCNRLGWSNLELLLSQFQERLQFGVQRELVDLVRLDHLNGQKARVLYNAGIKTISDLATSEPATIAQILHKAGPFSSNNNGESSKSIWMLGKDEGLTEAEAAQVIVQEARNFLQIELGLAEVQFRKDDEEGQEDSDKENKETVKENGIYEIIDVEDEDESMDIVENLTPHKNKNVSLLFRKSESFQESSDRITGNLMTSKMENSPAVENLPGTVKHSTPLQAHAQTSFTANVSNVNVPSPQQLSFTKNIQQNENERLEDEFDFEKEFLHNKFETSIVSVLEKSKEENEALDALTSSFMDVSFVQSEEEESELNANIKEELPLLSESILAAAAAVAQDDDDDSDSSVDILPPSPEILTQRLRSQQNRFISSNRSGALKENKTISQTLSNTSSSMELESFYSQKNSVRIFSRNFQVKNIKNPESMPIECFQSTCAIGFGLCLTPPPTQVTPSRIGLRILGRCPSAIRQSKSQPHSLTFCNGTTETIWIYQWHEKNDPGLKTIFKKLKQSATALAILDSKSRIKQLLENSNVNMSEIPKESNIWDPKIAQWLLMFEEDHVISRDEMIRMWMDQDDAEFLYTKSSSSDWSKDVIESLIAWKLMNILREKLDNANLWEHFVEIETEAVRPLILIELNGFGVDEDELHRIKENIEFNTALLELRAYQIAGRQFNLASSKEIKQILGHDLGMQYEMQGQRGTGKKVLSKVNHELAKIVMEWRKLSSALFKSVVPFNTEIKGGRVHGHYSHFTVTGRVVMSEPSLQCLPRDFSLSVGYSQTQIEEIRHYSRIKFGNKVTTLLAKIERYESTTSNNMISVRNAFVSSSGFVLLSADYSQLELRILAHLAQERKLLRILNTSHGDVFREIAAQWKGIPESEVTDDLRQEAKGITYGIIYGVGARTLSEQLNVTENEAAEFIRGFMLAYPSIRTFIDKTIRDCREVGYVETISGRRRYLEHINSNSMRKRAQAERQAVNSRIQGSASDLVKKAMIGIHNSLSTIYTSSTNHVNWTTSEPLKGIYCFPILNLHDELIYEVKESYLIPIATEIKRQMESCYFLNVQTPVVIKTGKTWSQLSPFQF